jgi:hypothetical protein
MCPNSTYREADLGLDGLGFGIGEKKRIRDTPKVTKKSEYIR